jgi:hypothetical protein
LWLDGRFEYATPVKHKPRGKARFPRTDSQIDDVENEAKRFTVTDPAGRTWLFEAENQEEKRKWMIAIKDPKTFLKINHEIRVLMAKFEAGTISNEEREQLEEIRMFDPSKIGVPTAMLQCQLLHV